MTHHCIFIYRLSNTVLRYGNNYPTRCNCVQFIYMSDALHVSGGISTHHQELITLYLQYLALMRPLLLATCRERGRMGPI